MDDASWPNKVHHIITPNDIVMCRVVHATNNTGSSLDDWIY
jgi:hypothetical protein